VDHPARIPEETLTVPEGHIKEDSDAALEKDSPLLAGVETNQERRNVRRSISLRRDEARWEKQQRVIEELSLSVETLEQTLELEKASRVKQQRALEIELEQYKERARVLQEELDKQVGKGVVLKRALDQQATKSTRYQTKLQSTKEVCKSFPLIFDLNNYFFSPVELFWQCF